MNHSCDPNCLFDGDELCIAARDIATDEEITYDYATSETESSSHEPFKCGCGTAACRGTITGRDCLLPSLRAKYAGHFTTFAMSFQAAHDAAADVAGAVGAAEAAVAVVAGGSGGSH
ncbi:MAG: SET domain-containing protein-lysine N-methyltransferase [Burkholderiaceae bacterium]|nr:SET domain-containing protein-lysine N-methyltransferase [Burkholderiaceae bacterium]